MRAPPASVDAEDPVLRQTCGPVAVIRLNRADRLNAVDGPMIAALREALTLAREAAEIRSIVLLGNGRCLMAGADLAVFKEFAY